MINDIAQMCRAAGQMLKVRLRAVENAKACTLFPESDCLYTPQQFFSPDELQMLIERMNPETPYRLTDRAGVSWLLYSVGGYTLLCGPVLNEILTRVEISTIFSRLPGSRTSRVHYYEGEGEELRHFREYAMMLPLVEAEHLNALTDFIFQMLGECAPKPEEKIDLLGFDPQQIKNDSISKYIGYYEDCEAGLIACVAHSSPEKVRSFVQALYQHSDGSASNNWNQALFHFAGIAMLARNGARRAQVPAAATEKVLQKYRSKALQSNDPDILPEIACELVEELCRLVNSCSSKDYSPMVSNVIDRVKSGFSEKITPGGLADEFGINASYLASTFKKENGMTLSAYINQVRLEYARTMLTVSNQDIGEICAHAGIQDQSYFARIFREKYGLSPTQYKSKLFGGHGSEK